MRRSVAEWTDYRKRTNAMRAENDAYDREVLGIEPLGKPASQATKAEREAYSRRREAAMKAKGIFPYTRRKHEPLKPIKAPIPSPHKSDSEAAE